MLEPLDTIIARVMEKVLEARLKGPVTDADAAKVREAVEKWHADNKDKYFDARNKKLEGILK